MEFKPPKELQVDDNIADNWKLFKQKFDIYLKASGKSKEEDDIKVALLLNCIGDDGIQIFNTFSLSTDDAKRLGKVIEAFDNYFQPRKNIIYCRFKFFTRKQEGESFDNFVLHLRKLAKECEFVEVESLIRDRIVIGISDFQLQERFLRLGKLTLNEAIALGRAAESSKCQAQALRGNSDSTVCVVKHTSLTSDQNETDNMGACAVSKTKTVYRCYKCGRQHERAKCPAFGKTCYTCGRKNHFSLGCKGGQKTFRSVQENCLQQDVDSVFINEVKNQCSDVKQWYEPVVINGRTINFKLDTGAQCNVLSQNVLKVLSIQVNLIKNNFKVLTYANEELKTNGSAVLSCRVRGQDVNIKFVIVKTNNAPLLGLNACVKLNLIRRIDLMEETRFTGPGKTCGNKQAFIEHNSDVFTGVGKFERKFKIEVKEGAVPVVNSVRRVPEAIKPKLKETLDRLVENGVIEPVEFPTDWVNNVVIIEKPDKSLRICLDPAQLNNVLKSSPYPIPSTEEMELLLRGKKFFTVLDMKDGFHQIELDYESSLLTTFITPFGKFKYNKLPFGLKISPEVFQMYNVRTFGDINHLGIYFDDFIIATDDEKTHNAVLSQVVDRARQNNVKFNANKLQYKVNKVKYLGLNFSEEGVAPDPEQVIAIMDLSEPKNKRELQSVLGMFTFLCKFIPNITQVTEPLRQLLRKNVEWNWSQAQQNAYKLLKNKVAEATTLKIFDPNLPIEIYVDASNSGFGACLIQKERPVAFSSRALTDAETRYPVIDKEMAAVCFAVNKYHKYIYGHKVVIYTDHKPLCSIVEKSINNVSSRLQKFKFKLLNYNLVVKYVPGKDNVLADILSRYVRNDNRDNCENEVNDCVMIHTLSNQLSMSDAKKQEFRVATEEDPILRQIVEHLKNGWPDKKVLSHVELRKFYDIKDELAVEDGLLFFKCKIVVPLVLRQNMLNIVHESHLGLNKCKARARQVLYWPNMSADIEKVVLKCKICEKFRFQNGKEPLLQHVQPTRPWEKVSSDLFEFGGKNYLTVVDWYSNWIELKELHNKSASSVMNALKEIFSYFGVPEYFMSDNVPFSSREFKQFSVDWNFKSITSSPHHPKSNGRAEKAVSICKNLLRRSLACNTDIHLMLLNYRSTPLVNFDVSPSQLFLNRVLKTKLPVSTRLLQPEVFKRDRGEKDKKMESYYNKASRKLKEFSEGDNVLIRSKNTWVPGKVIKPHDEAPRSYMIKDENGNVYRRNRVMLRKSYNNVSFKGPDEREMDEGVQIEECNNNDESVPHDLAINGSLGQNGYITDKDDLNVDIEGRLRSSYATRSGRIVRKPSRLICE